MPSLTDQRLMETQLIPSHLLRVHPLPSRAAEVAVVETVVGQAFGHLAAHWAAMIARALKNSKVFRIAIVYRDVVFADRCRCVF